MSKLSEKFAAGRKALAERQAADPKDSFATPSPFARAAGPLHGSVSTMKMDLLKSEVEMLRASNPVLKIRPNEIKASAWANRHADSFESSEFASFRAEIKSAGGNVQPIKVRPLKSPVDGVKYEIVYGHRRHRACLDLDIEVNAIVSDIDEKHLFIEMDRENRDRADLRPYEQGVMYVRALNEKLFPSIRKLAEDIGADSTNVSRAVALARLPEEILDSFASKLDIQYRWAAELKAAHEKEPDLILARAKDVRKQKALGNQLPSQVVFNLLVGSAPAASKPISREMTVGDRILKITEKNRKIAFELDTLPKDKITKIQKFIAAVMAE